MQTMSILAGYLTEPELAAQLKKSRRALQDWRQRRVGPPWTQLGNTILYSEASVRAWLKTLEQPVCSGDEFASHAPYP
jgi:helix-turn-helix protein